MARIPNYLNFVQFLTENFLLNAAATIRLGTGGNLSTKPISYKFGGNAQTRDQPWAISTGLKTREVNQSNFSGSGFVLTMNLGELRRVTNCLIRFGEAVGTDATALWQGVIECRTSGVFPQSFDYTTYTYDDLFYSRRPARDYLYFSLPRNKSYQHYRIKFFNPAGTTGGLTIRDVFIGDSVDVDRAPTQGISHQAVDLSETFTAESGREYFLKRPIYNEFGGMEFPLLERYQVTALSNWSNRIGTTTPFWMIADPWGGWDAPAFGATFGVFRLTSMPNFVHQYNNIWNATLSMKEYI